MVKVGPESLKDKSMQKKTVRSGLVGAGFSASFHFEAIKKVYGTNVDVVGVYAKDNNMARAYAQAPASSGPSTLTSYSP